MRDSCQEGSPLTGKGHPCEPPPGIMEAVGVAPEGAQLIASGLSTKVVETILKSKSSIYKETVRPEVETLHFIVRRPPARSQG